jgi:hypothetical protein
MHCMTGPVSSMRHGHGDQGLSNTQQTRKSLNTTRAHGLRANRHVLRHVGVCGPSTELGPEPEGHHSSPGRDTGGGSACAYRLCCTRARCGVGLAAAVPPRAGSRHVSCIVHVHVARPLYVLRVALAWPSCRGTHRAGGYHQCVVRVRERSAAKAGSARTLLM